MERYRFAFILITEIIRLIITGRFTSSFLKKDDAHYKRLIAYGSSAIITTGSYYFINISWMNLLSTLVGLAIISMSYSGSIKKKIQFVLYVLAISCIIDLAVYVLLSKTFDYENYSESASILSLLLLLVAQLFTKRTFIKNKDKELSNKHWWQYISILIVCIAASLAVIMDKNISPLSLSIVCGAFLAVDLIIVYLLDDLISTSQKEKENIVLKEQMKTYEREISLQKEVGERMRAFRHDIKHHLAEILSLANQGKTEMIKDYILDFEDNLKESAPICDSGNPALDTVLNFMLKKAKDNNIDVTSRIIVPREINLPAFDMNIILGNLIENAIEANYEVQDPKIDLSIKYMNGSLMIEIANTYSHMIIVKNKQLISTKQPSEDHGYGLLNIKRVLKKYTHSFDYDWTDTIFTVRILMNISQ